jgi:hypothetical protein
LIRASDKRRFMTCAAASGAPAPSEYVIRTPSTIVGRPDGEDEPQAACHAQVAARSAGESCIGAGGRYTAADVPAVNEAFAELHATWIAIVRAAYVEITGDEAGAKTMSASAMERELDDKGAGEEVAALRARVAEERAGLRPPPTPGTKLSALEEYVRASVSLGDAAEAALATAITGTATARGPVAPRRSSTRLTRCGVANHGGAKVVTIARRTAETHAAPPPPSYPGRGQAARQERPRPLLWSSRSDPPDPISNAILRSDRPPIRSDRPRSDRLPPG